MTERSVSDSKAQTPLLHRLTLPQWKMIKKTITNRLFLMGLPIVLIAFTGLWIYATGGRWVQTQNAYIKADKAQISAEVSGTVTAHLVADNQRVQAGDLLFSLDTKKYTNTLDAAKAAHDEALGQIRAAKANYQQRLSERELARENLAFAQQELERRTKLAARKIVPSATLEEYVHDRDVAAVRLKSKEQEIAVLRALLGDPLASADKHPSARGAQSKVALAAEDLAHTQIYAPITGIAASVPVVGDFIQAGAPTMVIVADQNLWVEANYKETALTHMRIGQSAFVRIDAYPEKEYRAHIQSINPASGAEFSILPAQNASGNWVKVVQRIPVRIKLESDQELPDMRAGMSVHVRVDTGHYRAVPTILRLPLHWMGADVGPN